MILHGDKEVLQEWLEKGEREIKGLESKCPTPLEFKWWSTGEPMKTLKHTEWEEACKFVKDYLELAKKELGDEKIEFARESVSEAYGVIASLKAKLMK